MVRHQPVRIRISENVQIHGDLHIPDEGSAGIVLFAHGSGSSRFSPRNKYVARVLNESGLSTLLVDLLTPEEEEVDDITREYRFDIEMLANRLVDISKWIKQKDELKDMKIGIFGASTGGGAAIVAASKFPIDSIVSRGGRVDLAGDALRKISCPTLCIVGGYDYIVLDMNRDAYRKMVNVKEKKLEIVEGASHLFEEPGKLQKVAALASDWFKKYLGVLRKT